MTESGTIEGEVVEEHEAETLPAVRSSANVVAASSPSLTVDELIARRDTIRDAMARAMEEDVHFGKIPGVSKPTLLKPGAEMLAVLFQFAISYPPEKRQIVRYEDGHMDVDTTVVLTHMPTGMLVAEGVGFCSTREKKYAYRSGALQCPECGAAEIRKSKQANKDEFYCWRKQGGCGATFGRDTDAYTSFVEQQKENTSRVANPDLADTYNTVVKMSAKRGLIAAVLNATGASDVFTQDMEDTQPQENRREPSSEARRAGGHQESAMQTDVPRTWAEIGKAIEKIEESDPALGLRDFWLPQALEAAFGKPSAKDLSAADKRTAAQKISSVIVRLWEHDPPLVGNDAMPPATRDQVARVVASVFEGAALIGPPWRMSPDEESLPTHADYREVGFDPTKPVVTDGSEEAERLADETVTGPAK